MRRVVVVGVAGVGKSTVARELARRLGVEHVELDSMFWQAGWTKLEPDEFERRVREATRGDGWVVDGNYSERIREIAWGAADAVVWLDLPRYVVMWQLVRRTLRRSISGVELWNGNRERSIRDQFSRDLSKSIVRWSWHTYAPTKAEYARLMRDPLLTHVQFVRLRSRPAVRRFVRSVSLAG